MLLGSLTCSDLPSQMSLSSILGKSNYNSNKYCSFAKAWTMKTVQRKSAFWPNWIIFCVPILTTSTLCLLSIRQRSNGKVSHRYKLVCSKIQRSASSCPQAPRDAWEQLCASQTGGSDGPNDKQTERRLTLYIDKSIFVHLQEMQNSRTETKPPWRQSTTSKWKRTIAPLLYALWLLVATNDDFSLD